MADIKLKDRNDNEITYTGISKLKVPAADGGEDVVFQLPPTLQKKTVSVTENGTTEITPDEGVDALSAVALTVDVPSSGSGAIPDWTQNDETAADYIKNRPGAYDIVQKTQAATGTFVGPSSEDLMPLPSAVAVEGQQVVVTVDGTDTVYTVPAPDGDGAVYFGTNPVDEFAGENPPENGYIFIVSAMDDGDGNTQGLGVATGSYLGKTWTLSLVTSTPVRIAAKYLDLDAVAAAAAAAQTAADTAQTTATNASETAKAADPNLSPLWGAEGSIKAINGSYKTSGTAERIFSADDFRACTGPVGSGRSIYMEYMDGRFTVHLRLQPIFGNLYQINTSDNSGGQQFIWDGKAMGDDTYGKLTFDPKTGLYSWTKEMYISGTFAISPSSKHVDGSEVFAASTIPPYVATPALLMISSTAGSNKLFRVTVDDSGTLKATEVDM